MAREIIQGKNFVADLGNGRVGCANSVSFSAEKEMIEAACREAGDYYDATNGKRTATISIEGLIIKDTPVVNTNFRAYDFADAYMNDTLLPFVIGSSTEGDKVWSGNAYVTSIEESGEQDGNATYSVSMQVIGQFFYAARPVEA